MGGKTKQAQRTKNNSRPSSSGRSAELLGSSAQTFVGFTGIENFGFVPVLPGFNANDNLPDEFDANVDPTYQLVLRKMMKKDPTTKVKALQEFSELVANSEVDSVKAILPFWPRLYTSLAMDVEHRVRESTQLAQNAVVTKVGKHIAPYLRQLAPSWVISQYDTYAPASSIATNCFQKAFPPHKVKEVFNFCQNEILDFIIKNITVHTQQTLSNPKSHTTEESEAKYQRVITCSLKGYSLYLDKIEEGQLKEALIKNSSLIDNPKFWSFHKHKSNNIRSAWFEVISSLMENGLDLLDKHEIQLSLCVLSNLDEIDPTVLPHVWACILLVQSKYENWHKHINLEKVLLPKLWKTIKSGGNGNARTIFPHMLPLISKFTKNVLNDKIMKFYLDFFENFTEGLKTKSIQTSRTDICAVSTAYYECLQYIIIQLQTKGILSNDEINEVCIKLVDEHLLEIIKWCLNTEVSYEKHIFYQISPLLNYWSQNSNEYPLYDLILKQFWSKLFDLIKISLETNEHIERIIETQIELIKSLKSSMINQNKKKHVKVKFSSDDNDVDSCKINTIDIIGYETELNDLVYKLCDIFIENADKTKQAVYVEKFEILLKSFDQLSLFKKLINSDDIKLLCEKFINWLTHDELRLEIVVNIILEVYKFLTVEEKINLLKNLIEFPNETVQNWTIIRILSHPLCNESHIPQLLGQTQVSEHLVKCANRVINGETMDNLNLLHKCFFQTDSGDILINIETCEMIVDVLSQPFNDCDKEEVLDTCGSFLAQIMPVIFTDDAKITLQHKMFLILFEFSINKMISDDLSEDTLWEITSSWQDTLSSNDLKLNDFLLKKCSNIVENKLNSTETISIKILENIAEITAKLILCATENITDEKDKLQMIDKIIDSILNEKSKEYKENTKYLEHFSILIETMNGRISITTLSDDKTLDLTKYDEILFNFIKSTIFKLNVVIKLTCNIKNDLKNFDDNDDENQDDELTEDYCDLDENLIKNWSNEIYEQIFDIFYGNNLIDILLFNSDEIDPLTESLMLYLGERLNIFLTSISTEILNPIKEKLFAIVNKNGLLWSNCLLPFLRLEQYCDKENGAVLLYEDVTISTSKDEENILKYINILQTLAQKISSNCLPINENLFENLTNIFIKLISTRCLITNHFNSNFNEINDRKIIVNSLNILTEITDKSREDINYLLYNKDLTDDSFEKIAFVTETINFLSEAINYFPTEFDIKQWDFVRIALSSWTLSVSKSLHNFQLPKISIFISAVYKLFVILLKFINLESTKSSTGKLAKVIEEWEHVFAKDVNLVLLKSFITIVNTQGNLNQKKFFLDVISPTILSIDLKHVIRGNKIDSKTSLNDLIVFCLKQCSHPCHKVKIASVNIIKKIAVDLIAKDLDLLNKRNEQEEKQNKDESTSTSVWHILHEFAPTIEQHHAVLGNYIKDFNFKINETTETEKIPKNESLPYLLLWESIIYICAKSTSEIRSIYATWITDNKYEQTVLPILFKIMPADVLKNPDTKIVFGQTMFTPLEWKQISNSTISPDRYACHIFGQMLRYLPAVVRKWWHDLNSRCSSLVEKITTNCVSPLVCQEELRGLIDKKEKYDNMQIKVHTSTREVIATYAIDETRMELVITLPLNHPLGSVKVESGKQIGGRLQSRVLVMQLTIFLTHQNGSIWDGLSLWKRNLDRKFEGVEECYVCYSVIHQDTCQLPKLSCKTCKKKFHGPCLYKWFSTSNKSTCPICRNIF